MYNPSKEEFDFKVTQATLFLLLEILSATIPNSWYSRRFEMWEGDKADKRVSMVKRSDRDIINPDAWNQTMKPGMEFELVFAGETALVQSVLVAVRDEVYRDVVSAEIGYVAAIYQHHNGGNYPEYLRQITFKEPLTKDSAPLTRHQLLFYLRSAMCTYIPPNAPSPKAMDMLKSTETTSWERILYE